MDSNVEEKNEKYDYLCSNVIFALLYEYQKEGNKQKNLLDSLIKVFLKDFDSVGSTSNIQTRYKTAATKKSKKNPFLDENGRKRMLEQYNNYRSLSDRMTNFIKEYTVLDVDLEKRKEFVQYLCILVYEQKNGHPNKVIDLSEYSSIYENIQKNEGASYSFEPSFNDYVSKLADKFTDFLLNLYKIILEKKIWDNKKAIKLLFENKDQQEYHVKENMIIEKSFEDERNVEQYFNQIKEELDVITTLIDPNRKCSLSKVYVPNDIFDIEFGKQTNIEDSLNKNNYLFLKGNKLQGKTMLLKHLALQLTETYQSKKLIPVYLSVRRYENQKIEDLIEKIFPFYNQFNNLILLIDDYSLINIDYLHLFKDRLNEYMRKHKYHKIIIVSSKNDIVPHMNFRILSLLPFTEKQASELENTIQNVYNDLEIPYQKVSELFTYFPEELSNPFLIILLISIYSKKADSLKNIYTFFDSFIETIFLDYELKNGSFKSTSKSKLEIEDFKLAIGYFCANTQLESGIGFNKQDFKNSIDLFIHDHFTKTGNQEYIPINLAYSILDDLDSLGLVYKKSVKEYVFIYYNLSEFLSAYYFSYLLHDKNLLYSDLISVLYPTIIHTENDSYVATLPLLYESNQDLFIGRVVQPFIDSKFQEYQYLENGYNQFLLDFYPTIYFNENENCGYNNSKLTPPSSILYYFFIKYHNITHRNLYLKDIEEKNYYLLDPFYEESLNFDENDNDENEENLFFEDWLYSTPLDEIQFEPARNNEIKWLDGVSFEKDIEDEIIEHDLHADCMIMKSPFTRESLAEAEKLYIEISERNIQTYHEVETSIIINQEYFNDLYSNISENSFPLKIEYDNVMKILNLVD